MRDVAEASGVSPMTVSNLMNGRVGSMRPETRLRIEAQIEKLGYRPHTMARSLRLSKRLSIGIVIVSGMAIGTLFTLFVLPTFYTLLATDHREIKRQKRSAEIAAVS